MRVTFSPGSGLPELDLELAVGVTLGSLRDHLAAATGCQEARSGDLAVGAVVLDDTHLTAAFPLVAGARLSLGKAPSADDGVFAAVRARRHLAVLAGPDAGLLWPVVDRLGVGRPSGALVSGGLAGGVLPSEGLSGEGRGLAEEGTRADRMDLADPLVSTRHLEVRSRRGRVWVRDLGSVNGARRAHRWSSYRVTTPVPRWWTRWRDGDRVTAGTSVLELRSTADQAGPARSRGRSLLVGVAAVGPALGSLALVAGTGNPALLALGLAGPALATLLHRATPPARTPDPPPSTESVRNARVSDSGITDSGNPHEFGGGGAVVAADLAAGVARAVLTGQGSGADDALEQLAPTGTLAVCGAGAREVAATLVLAAQPAGVDVQGPGSEHWAWAHWLSTAPAGAGGSGPDVVIVDGGATRPEGGGPGRIVVLVAPDRVPSWCTARLDAATGHWSGPDGERTRSVLAGSPTWAARQARLIAGARSVRAAGDGGLPESVTLGGLDLPSSTESITAAWHEADAGLRAVLGAGPGGGAVVVDLAREGPHALVAGTTGSGKSELLRALVASLALRYPPTALAFALVDFKGGAGFGALSELPHVVGTVTDLDAHEAARAIGGLAAELRTRKELLARVGVTDLRDWPAASTDEPHPGRLVVVVDEFRALAEELPDLMGALVRVATQGRSLGVHLVLATQRPSGVVSAELRANVALRLALRVTDAGDSSDVIDVPDAAAISPSLPGRALLRRGPGPIEEIQVAQVGAGAPPVRLARGAVVNPSPALEPDAELVTAVTAAATQWLPGAPRPSAPWLPALPDDVTPLDLASMPRADDGARSGVPAASPPQPPGTLDAPGQQDPQGLPFALADVPDTQSRSVVTWQPRSGHLLAVGGPGTGKSTLLATIGTAALARGWAVHAVGLPGAEPESHSGLPPGVGTVCGPDDPRRLARLITLLAEAPPKTILLVDGIESVWQALETVARGSGADRFAELLRARAVGVAMTSAGGNGPWAKHATERLVLPVVDASAEELAGVPRALIGGRRGPGRAIWLPARADALVCQVAWTPHTHASGDPASGPGSPGLPEWLGELDATPLGSGSPLTPPVRLAPIPLVAARPARSSSRRPRLVVGAGGDAATPLGLDPAAGGIVVGPPGSGRSTALAHVLLSATGLGLAPLTIARDGPVLATGAAIDRGFGFERDALLEALERREPETAVVVDDLDALARLLPDVADALDDAVDDGAPVFASMTTTAALGAYRGLVATLRAKRHGIVLGAHSPGSDEVFGSALAWHTDPARPTHPGRGVLQSGSRLSAVQVFAPPA